MLKILQSRLQQYMNHELPDVQAGFIKGRGTRDQIANIHWIIEKSREFQKNPTSASPTMLLVLLLSRFSRVWLCDPIDGSRPGSPVPGILQARTPEWVAISFSNAWKWKVKSEREVTQSCLTPSDPMDCSPPGFSVHGILQARVLEWGAIAFSHVPLNVYITKTVENSLRDGTTWLPDLPPEKSVFRSRSNS